MEMDMKDDFGVAAERLMAAASLLEQAVERLTQSQSAFAVDAEASIGRIVATVEGQRELELEKKLATAEAEIATLRAAAEYVSSPVTHGRRTLPMSTVSLLAKQGVGEEAAVEPGALDTALASLSMEQRFAVKAQLHRAGLLG